MTLSVFAQITEEKYFGSEMEKKGSLLGYVNREGGYILWEKDGKLRRSKIQNLSFDASDVIGRHIYRDGAACLIERGAEIGDREIAERYVNGEMTAFYSSALNCIRKRLQKVSDIEMLKEDHFLITIFNGCNGFVRLCHLEKIIDFLNNDLEMVANYNRFILNLKQNKQVYIAL